MHIEPYRKLHIHKERMVAWRKLQHERIPTHKTKTKGVPPALMKLIYSIPTNFHGEPRR